MRYLKSMLMKKTFIDLMMRLCYQMPRMDAQMKLILSAILVTMLIKLFRMGTNCKRKLQDSQVKKEKLARKQLRLFRR